MVEKRLLSERAALIGTEEVREEILAKHCDFHEGKDNFVLDNFCFIVSKQFDSKQKAILNKRLVFHFSDSFVQSIYTFFPNESLGPKYCDISELTC